MNVRELVSHAGRWLSGAGPQADIVISSRIRLARNVTGYPFLSQADEHQRQELVDTVHSALAGSDLDDEMRYGRLDEMDEIERQVLVERQLISRQHANAEGIRAVAVGAGENIALMINEEDHLRMQVLRSGLQLDDAWEQISAFDDHIGSSIEYAFHKRFGYLTACPTNVGTGIRVSVMLHLPGLKMTGEIERVLRAARDMRLAVRGLFGEGTEATGDFFQVSNQTTLGKSEPDIIDDFKNTVIPRIVEYEHRARRTLAREKAVFLDDKIWRAMGVLRNARAISSEESLYLLSHIRLGIHLGRIEDIDIKTVNDLFVLTQPAHLQTRNGQQLSPEQRSSLRAEYIRERLTGASGEQHQ